MNEKNYFTIVVPLSPDAPENRARQPISRPAAGGGLVAGGGTHEAAFWEVSAPVSLPR